MVYKTEHQGRGAGYRCFSRGREQKMAISASSFAGEVTADEIIQNMVDSYEKQMRDIKDVTIISEVIEGEEKEKEARTEVECRKRAEVEGKTVCKRREELNNGEDITLYDGEYVWEWYSGGEVTKKKVDSDPSGLISDEILKKIEAEFIGTEKIGGDETYVLRIKNMIDLMAFSPGERKMGGEVRGKA